MKKRIGVLILALAALLCAHALGAETVSGSLGDLRIEALTEGFGVPVPEDAEGFRAEQRSDHYLSFRSTDTSAPNSLYIDAYVFDPMDEFAERNEDAEAVYNRQNYAVNEEYQEENVIISKHIARICVFRGKGDAGDYSVGILHYVRNNRMLQIRLYSEPQNGTAWENLPKVTAEDMRNLAEKVVYDPERASVTEDDGQFTLTAGEGTETLTAGKTVKISAVFNEPEKIVKRSWNDSFKWSVKDEATGRRPNGVSISKTGELTADRQISDTIDVIISAESRIFHTTAALQMQIVPAVRRLSADPSVLPLYTGMKEPTVVRVVPDPRNVPLPEINWTAAKSGIVEIIPGEEGTAAIKALKAGSTMITATEPGGKSAKMTVNVTQAVEDIQLSVRGNPVPYGIVTVQATVLPKNAGNRNLTWTLDVGPQIATIRRGEVTIGGRVEPGTVITVTCTADGAPEPIVRTVQIEVKKR